MPKFSEDDRQTTPKSKISLLGRKRKTSTYFRKPNFVRDVSDEESESIKPRFLEENENKRIQENPSVSVNLISSRRIPILSKNTSILSNESVPVQIDDDSNDSDIKSHNSTINSKNTNNLKIHDNNLSSYYKDNGKPQINNKFGIKNTYNNRLSSRLESDQFDFSEERERKMQEIRESKNSESLKTAEKLYLSLKKAPVKPYSKRSSNITFKYKTHIPRDDFDSTRSIFNQSPLKRKYETDTFTKRPYNEREPRKSIYRTFYDIEPTKKTKYYVELVDEPERSKNAEFTPEKKFDMDPEIMKYSGKKFLVYNGIELHGEDIARLQPGEMLNDAIIDFYLLNLQLTMQSDSIHIFNTQFYQLLKRRAEIDRYVKTVPSSVNIFDKDFVFIPINENVHWSLVVLCYPGNLTHENHCILYCDSLYNSTSNIHINYIRDYLTRRYFHEREREREFNEENYPLNIASLPKQTNSYDCGVYMIHYVEYFVRNGINSFPVKLKDLFNTYAVRSKRKDIYSLIQKLRSEYSPNVSIHLDESDDEVTVVTIDRPKPMESSRSSYKSNNKSEDNDSLGDNNNMDSFEFRPKETKTYKSLKSPKTLLREVLSDFEDDDEIENSKNKTSTSSFRFMRHSNNNSNNSNETRHIPILSVPESPDTSLSIYDTPIDEMKIYPNKRRRLF